MSRRLQPVVILRMKRGSGRLFPFGPRLFFYQMYPQHVTIKSGGVPEPKIRPLTRAEAWRWALWRQSPAGTYVPGKAELERLSEIRLNGLVRKHKSL